MLNLRCDGTRFAQFAASRVQDERIQSRNRVADLPWNWNRSIHAAQGSNPFSLRHMSGRAVKNATAPNEVGEVAASVVLPLPEPILRSRHRARRRHAGRMCGWCTSFAHRDMPTCA